LTQLVSFEKHQHAPRAPFVVFLKRQQLLKAFTLAIGRVGRGLQHR
jgi:hypothetical protein